jgi:hypothetical protein
MVQRMFKKLSGIAILSCAVIGLALGGGKPMAQTLPPSGPPSAVPNPLTAPSKTGVNTAESRINKVTVYLDSALVGRTVTVPPGKGLVELVVSPLPPNTVPTSLYCEASQGLRVLATRFRTRQVERDVREEVRKLDEEKKKLQSDKARLDAAMEALEGEKGFLGKLESFAAASTTHATEKGKLDSNETISLAKYLSENRKNLSEQKVSNQEKIAEIQEKLAFLARKASEAGRGAVLTQNDAVLVVEKIGEAGGTVNLNYLVNQASWKPMYRLRAGKKPSDPVSMEYLAALTQETGEDWSAVRLTLSNAQPMLNASPPDLKALAVSIVPRPVGAPGTPLAGKPGQIPAPSQSQTQQALDNLNSLVPNAQAGSGVLNTPIPNPDGLANSADLANATRALRSAGQRDYNRRQEKQANDFFNYAGALDQARDLVITQEDKKDGAGDPSERQGPSLSYPLQGEFTIASRSDEQILEVQRLEMKADHFFKAVPVLTSHVYRQATLVNSSGNVFLPGEATIYHDGEFVGRMNIPLVASGEKFTVGFGVEPQLQVARKLVDKGRTVQGGNQILRYQYNILVSSYRGEVSRLQLWDRLPLAEKEAITATLGDVVPALCQDPLYMREDRSRNLLRWDLDIAPGSFGEKAVSVKYDFKLELDKQMGIGSYFTK